MTKKPQPPASAQGNGKTTRPAAARTPVEAKLPDAVTLKKLAPHIAKVRAHVRESFGKVVMTMMMLPRYRNQTVADLQHLVLEPLIRDRLAIAYPGGKDQDALADLAGLAI